jgi:HD-like signal output (HDOD) protein
LITREQLQEALARQQQTGAKIVATLIALGHIEQSSFLKFLARQPGIASIHLAGYDITHQTLKFVPGPFARKHEIIPMDKMGNELTVGMACPLDIAVIAELESLTQMRVRALLVAPEAIQIALDKYYPEAEAPSPVDPSDVRHLAATLTLDRVMALVRGVSALPAMPDTVQRVQAAVEDPAMGAADVAEILKGDPALAAKVISLANAPVHGIRHRIDSVEAATAMLGLREVYSVAIAAALVERFSGAPTFDYAAHWRRSAVCGTTAKILARSCRGDFGSGVFAAGLLLDIGQLVFAEVAPGAYAALDHGVDDATLIQAEHDTFGIAHPEAGYVVARNWALPESLSESIRFHHQPECAESFPELVRLIALAARLTDHLEYPEIVPLASCAPMVEAFGIDENQLSSILSITRALRDSSTI